MCPSLSPKDRYPTWMGAPALYVVQGRVPKDGRLERRSQEGHVPGGKLL